MIRTTMDKKTADTILECKILLNELAKDVQELKGNTLLSIRFIISLLDFYQKYVILYEIIYPY